MIVKLRKLTSETVEPTSEVIDVWAGRRFVEACDISAWVGLKNAMKPLTGQKNSHGSALTNGSNGAVKNVS